MFHWILFEERCEILRYVDEMEQIELCKLRGGPGVSSGAPKIAPLRPDPGTAYRPLRDLQGTGRNVQGPLTAIHPPSTTTTTTQHVPANAHPHTNRPSRAMLNIKIGFMTKEGLVEGRVSSLHLRHQH